MKARTVQGGVCYPSRLAGINGGQPEARSEKTDTEVKCRKAEVKTEYDRTRKRNRIRENPRRPEAQDADNSEGFGIQEESNVCIIITECNCESDIK
jgi:hypothetical protein